MEVFFNIVAAGITLAVFLVARKISAAMRHHEESLRAEPTATPSTGSRRSSSGTIFYRSSNGRSDYKFRIQQLGPSRYRVYVLRHPSYGSRDTNDLETHLLRDARGPYICYTGHLKSVKEARNLAATWADKTEEYILRGQRF